MPNKNFNAELGIITTKKEDKNKVNNEKGSAEEKTPSLSSPTLMSPDTSTAPDHIVN